MFVSSLTMGGITVGVFLLGPLPDLFVFRFTIMLMVNPSETLTYALLYRIGRRKSVLILSIWISVFGIGLSFSRNYEEFAVLRFLNGMGCIALMQALAIWGRCLFSKWVQTFYMC